MPHKGFSHSDPANEKKNGDSAMHEKLMSNHIINFLLKRDCHPYRTASCAPLVILLGTRNIVVSLMSNVRL